MQPLITLTQLFPFTGVFTSWIMSTFSQANEKDTNFQTHYDWTAVPLGTFQNQQSQSGRTLTATAGSCNGVKDTLPLPHS